MKWNWFFKRLLGISKDFRYSRDFTRLKGFVGFQKKMIRLQAISKDFRELKIFLLLLFKLYATIYTIFVVWSEFKPCNKLILPLSSVKRPDFFLKACLNFVLLITGFGVIITGRLRLYCVMAQKLVIHFIFSVGVMSRARSEWKRIGMPFSALQEIPTAEARSDFEELLRTSCKMRKRPVSPSLEYPIATLIFIGFNSIMKFSARPDYCLKLK